jgi:emp24/gp25L/p24 family/GOLD
MTHSAAFKDSFDSTWPHISLQVTDPKNKIVYEKKGELDGRFAFTTTETGDYKACFTARGAMSILHAAYDI